MADTIELESIRRLDINPGDTLVATLPSGIDCETFHAVNHALRAALPDVKLLVVTSDVDLTVVHPDHTPPDQPGTTT